MEDLVGVKIPTDNDSKVRWFVLEDGSICIEDISQSCVELTPNDLAKMVASVAQYEAGRMYVTPP